MGFDREKIIQAGKVLEKKIGNKPSCAVVLGSGLAGIIKNKVIREVPFEEIPGMCISGVPGHKNKFLLIESQGKPVLVMQGRLHLYEGFSSSEVAFPIALLGESGIRNIVLTNAAGGINASFNVGDIMMITDHINLQAASPLTGMDGSEKFIDMSHVYDVSSLRELADRFGIRSGVYAGVLGPQYETPSEIRFMRAIGADAVGMSTVTEAIMAKYYLMKLSGFSLITNKAAGMGEALSHNDVMIAGKSGGARLWEIVEYLIGKI